jgi:acyl transferase domain-containing protein/NADPH:quinone reductase-like Zn-dependent oxidoreductase/NAD(P)-dependent dehydrogenase (short-subunit alcohol dehydrogenase family)/acyl carrier protein
MAKKNSKVAIVGMSHRLPGGSGDQFWNRLVSGEDLVSEVEEGRWAKESYLHPRKSEPGTSYTFAAGSVPNATAFDAAFFGISPREAIQMDPQQRILLELTWEALEDAGVPASRLKAARCGVFIGISSFDYAHRLADDLSSVDSKTPTGNAGSIAANRISYFLDARGPSMIIDTACSSALVAFHEACRSIQAGDSEYALAGGVSLHFHPLGFLTFTKTGMLSPTGRCRAFDANADGYVRSEGGGVLLLKPLEKALDDGDRVLAVVESSGVNCDGRTSGITVPSGEAQAALLREVYSRAGIKPEDLDYLEAHGTGTAVGDPIETWAIGEVLGKARPQGKPLPIGSVKSNLGHLEAASAVAGWTKVLLMLRHRQIPPNLHFEKPNPRIDFHDLNLRVVSEAEPLPKRKRLVVGINSFGFGGANAHVVLSLPTPKNKKPPALLSSGPLPFVFTAKTQEALRAAAARLADFLDEDRSTSLYDVAFALKERREWLPKRGVVLATDRESLIENLRNFSEGLENNGVIDCEALPDGQHPVFVFSGNGGQWEAMGRQLYAEDSAFRQAVRHVDVEFQKTAPFSLLPHFEGTDLPGGVSRTEIAQPLIFAIQVGLVESLASRGLRPAAVIGHSLGEVAGAWACGSLDLASAVLVIRLRSLHQESTRGLGGMTAVAASRVEVEHLLKKPAVDGICVVVSGENGPSAVTVAGAVGDLEALEQILAARSIQFKRLDLDYPFHSPLMDSLLVRFREDLGEPLQNGARVPFYSTVVGDRLAGTFPPDYWAMNIREPVRFRAAVDSACRDGRAVFLEIGPQPVLCNHVNAVLRDTKTIGSALGAVSKNACGLQDIDTLVLRLIVGGIPCDWGKYFPYRPECIIELPHYPWQRENYLLPVSPEGGGMLMRFKDHPLLGYRLRDSAWSWENHIDVETLPWLADHKVGGAVVYPAAAFLESALAAGAIRHGSEQVRVEGLEIRSPLVLPQKRSKTIRLLLEEESGRFSIQSRDRMSEDAWQPHVVGRIASQASKIRPAPLEVPPPNPSSPEKIYETAAELGLDYGPAFRALDSISSAGRAIAATLSTPSSIKGGIAAHLIHPVFVDASMQSLLCLFQSENGNPPAQAFLPVRFESFDLIRSKTEVVSTGVEVRRHGKRSLLADLQFYGADGSLVAFCSGARFRAAQLVKRSFDRARILVSKWIPRALPGRRSFFENREKEVVGWLRAAMDAMPETCPAKRYAIEGDALLDSLCTAFAYEHFRKLADEHNLVALENIIAVGSLVQEMTDYFHHLAAMLEQDKLIECRGRDIWELNLLSDLPPAQEIWRALVSDFPEKSEWIGLAGSVGLHLDEILSGRKTIESCLPKWTRHSTDEILFPGSALESELQLILGAALQSMGSGRLLWISSSRPSQEEFPAPWMRESGCAITMLAPSGLDLDNASNRLASFPEVEVIHAPLSGDPLGEILAEGRLFDVIVAPNALMESNAGSLAALLSSGGILLGILPEESRLFDFVQVSTFGDQRSCSGCMAATQAAFRCVEKLPFLSTAGMGPSILFATGTTNTADCNKSSFRTLVVALDDDTKFDCDALALALDGVCEALPPLEKEALRIWSELLEKEKPERVVFISSNQNSPQSTMAELCAVASFFKVLSSCVPSCEVFIVTHGALSMSNGNDWMASALWGFARVARNEYSQFRLRCIDWDGFALGNPSVLAEEILSMDAEDEVRLTTRGRLVSRVAFADNDSKNLGEAVLDFDAPGPFQNLKWKKASIRKPEANEVEIEVRAAGLNFRDVMYAMGLLPDEALESGFAGPTLGMELSGVIVSAGSQAGRFRPGDEVIAFAPASFAKRAITSLSAVMPKPPGISFEAAATIPAAFFTAWHALVDLAGLRRGERVLIHGAAGGVGIAAIQIARWIGAEIFATAGTNDKRDFVKLLGANYIYDSRSLDFGGEILAATQGEGVDVILNSLAGEAVSVNLEILRPFGRFLELGKRDFYENNRVALRPFRNNIRYFAVDADQLMALRPGDAASAFERLMKLFDEGVLSPLPYCVFRAADAAEAFRYMQHSSHTGKIVLRLDDIPQIPSHLAPATPTLDAQGTYLVTGGMTGFGLETAKWLVKHGAKSLVLISRRGLSALEAIEFVDSARTAGIRVLAEPCDVTNQSSVSCLLDRIRANMPPLRGVFHAAMVLNDSLIANSDSSQVEAVFTPKVTGAAILDKLTRKDPLDYFVLYSSATTLFGNPGQAFYVAANTALEELAATRREHGLPATCISWGPIGDTGYLSRNQQIKDALVARTGGHPLESRDALQFLGRALATSTSGLAWMDFDWQSLSHFLPSASSSRYLMLSQFKASTNAQESSSDFRKELELLDRPELIQALKGLLKEEISAILRVPIGKLDDNRPLLETGMDSLMGVELMTSLESALGINIPIMALSEAPTIAKLAERLAHVIQPIESGAEESGDDLASRFRTIAQQHGVEGGEALVIADEIRKTGDSSI